MFGVSGETWTPNPDVARSILPTPFRPADSRADYNAEDALESFVVPVFVEDPGTGIAPVQSVINPARLVRTFGSWHQQSLTTPNRKSMSPDPNGT